MKQSESPFIIGCGPDNERPILGPLREADVEEIYATGYSDPNQALFESWNASRLRWTVIWKRNPIALFGVVPDWRQKHRGIVWMLGTDQVEEIKVSMVRLGKVFIKRMLEEYPVLCNLVYEHNTKAIRWLKHMGFTVNREPSDAFSSGKKFYYFEIRREE